MLSLLSKGYCYTKSSAVHRTTILSYEGYSCANGRDIDDNTNVFFFCHIVGISTYISCVIIMQIPGTKWCSGNGRSSLEKRWRNPLILKRGRLKSGQWRQKSIVCRYCYRLKSLSTRAVFGTLPLIWLFGGLKTRCDIHNWWGSKRSWSRIWRRPCIVERQSSKSMHVPNLELVCLKYVCACIEGEQHRSRVESRKALKVISRRGSLTCNARSNKLKKTALSEFDSPCVTTACLKGRLNFFTKRVCRALFYVFLITRQHECTHWCVRMCVCVLTGHVSQGLLNVPVSLKWIPTENTTALVLAPSTTCTCACNRH